MNILDKLVSIFLEFKPGKLIIILLLLTLIFIIVFPIIKHNLLYVWKMEKRINMLKEISEINMETISKDKRLNEEYDKILNDLNSFSNESDSITDLLFVKTESTHLKKWKFITGGIIFWLMLFTIPFADYEDMKERLSAFVIILILGGIFGFIGLKIPTFYNEYINYIVYPLMQIIFFAWLAVGITKNQKESH
ncbi:MAG: hypothetical protein ACOCRK_09955 [bacterium]